MTPTPDEARAELQRRKENRERKAKGKPTVHVASSELTKARSEQLRAWADAPSKPRPSSTG